MKHRAVPIAVLVTLSLCVGLIAIFRPNGDVGAFIQHSATAAWIQAVGSIVAIGAAVWIDQGAARRQIDQEARSRQAARADWQECLSRVVSLVGNAERLVGHEMTDDLDDEMPARLIDNAVMMVDAYLRQPPPDPTLAFVLAAARSHLEIPREAIRDRRSRDPKFLSRSYSTRLNLVSRIQTSTHIAAGRLRTLGEEYRQGLF